MRRPLCYFAMALITVIFIFNKLFPADNPLLLMDGSWELCQGTVYSKEYQKDKLLVYLKDISLPEKPDLKYQGVLVFTDKANEPRLYSKVVFKGRVSNFKTPDNPGEFNSKQYYDILKLDFSLKDSIKIKESKKYSKYKEYLYSFKTKAEASYDVFLSENDSAIMKAIVLGNKKQMDKTQKQLYQMNGISHIMAISGMHISILGVSLYKLLKRLKVSGFISAFMPVMLIILYGDMVGLSSSSFRAIVMFALKLIADYIGRRYDVYSAMSLSAILILIEQPKYIYNTGFLLSFLAIFGVCLFTKQIKLPKENKVISKYIYEPLTVHLSIFLLQLPVILYFFYEYPIISFLTNIIILPIIPGLLVLGLCLIPYPFISFGINILPELAHLIIFCMEKICTFTIKIPGFVWVAGRPKTLGIFLYYVLLLFIYLRFNKLRNKQRIIFIVMAIGILTFKFEPGLELNYLCVGQGNCTVISDNRGHDYIVDCGSTTKSGAGEYTLLPFLRYKGISNLDGVFITHLDNDHLNGITELLEHTNEIRINKIYLSDSVIKDEKYYDFLKICKRKKIKIVYLKYGDLIKSGKLTFKIYHPRKGFVTEDDNSYSLVLGMEYVDFRALFPGDIPEEIEGMVLKRLDIKDIDVFLSSHHGSKYSNSAQFLNQLKPKLTIISCAEKNTYGHPHKEAVERIEKTNSNILITYESGAVTIRTNGVKHLLNTFH